MKVLIITNCYPSEVNSIHGIFNKEQVDDLLSLGLDVDVLHINTKANGYKDYFKKAFDVIKVKNNYDVINAQHIFVGLLLSFFVPTKKLVVTLLSDENNNLRGVFRLLGPFARFIFKRLVGFVITKKAYTHQVSKIADFVIPNGVDLNRFKIISRTAAREKLGLNQTKNYALFVSANHIRPEKQIDLYYEILDQLNKKGITVTPLIMTSVSRELVPYYFNAADLMVLTSKFEGSPNAVKEALACGTPVLSTDVGDVRDIIEDAPYCMLIDNELGDYLYKHVESIIDDKSLLCTNEIREKIREQLITNGYSSKVSSEKLLSIYKKVSDLQK